MQAGTYCPAATWQHSRCMPPHQQPAGSFGHASVHARRLIAAVMRKTATPSCPAGACNNAALAKHRPCCYPSGTCSPALHPPAGPAAPTQPSQKDCHALQRCLAARTGSLTCHAARPAAAPSNSHTCSAVRLKFPALTCPAAIQPAHLPAAPQTKQSTDPA